MREYVLADDQSYFDHAVRYYAFAKERVFSQAELLHLPWQGVREIDATKRHGTSLFNPEHVYQDVDWRAKIESTFVNPAAGGIGPWYVPSATRIFECIQLLWSACRKDEYVRECHSALVAALCDGLRLQSTYGRRGVNIEKHALALIVGSLFARREHLLSHALQVVDIDPPSNRHYPVYEKLASFLAAASQNDWQTVEQSIVPLSKFKNRQYPRVPTEKMLTAMYSQDRRLFEAAMRDIPKRFESTLRIIGKIHVTSKTRLEFDFWNLLADVRIPNIDLSCVLIMSRIWPDLQPDSFWIPKRLLDGRFG